MGTVTAICISKQRGTPKQPVSSAQFVSDYGIQGDAHAGNWHRQVSLLQQEKIDAFRERGVAVAAGAFGENLAVTGIDFRALPVRCNLVFRQAAGRSIGREAVPKPPAPCVARP